MRNFVLQVATVLIVATAAFSRQRSQLPLVTSHKKTNSRFGNLRRKC
jgi:hypothetical protein